MVFESAGFLYICAMDIKKDRVVLGIDPGTNIMGYGILSGSGAKPELIAMGVLKLEKFDDYALRLKKIFERTLSLVEEFKPDELAIEAPFYGKNIQSMLKLGRAQGVAMAAALYRQVPIFEYLPKKVKMSVTGNGNASKEQVAGMLKTLIKLNDRPAYLDATDAVAVALCHLFQGKFAGSGQNKAKGKSGSWGKFLTENPGRQV